MRPCLSSLLGAVTTLCAAVHAGDSQPADMFPFVISYDSPRNVVNMSHLLRAPAGADGRLRVSGDQFVNDRGPIRLHATNLTGAANFPTHEEAERLADRLARFGFNCVRLHYFDADYGNFMQPHEQGIIARDFRTRRRLDPERRDRQDYLIAALKKRGIYVNINLHVARTLDARDGFAPGNPWANKGVDAFDPRVIELEREYARDLLTHVNPYTKLPYTDDPCVALVELNNEDSIFNQYLSGGLDNLGQPYATIFRNLWNDWLLRKYGSSEKMRESWNITHQPLGDELIPEGTFDHPVAMDGTTWHFDALRGAQATTAPRPGALRLIVEASGDDYNPKLHRRVSVRAGQPYTVSFRIRRVVGEGQSDLGFGVADAVNGWRNLGLLRRFRVGRDWLDVTQSFNATADSDEATIQFTRFAPGEYELDRLSFRPGSNEPAFSEFRIEDGAMPLVRSTSCAPEPVHRDFYQFLVDTERTYWTSMRDYLVRELKVKAPISGTQMGYSPAFVQAELDYIDHHAYWCHPTVNANWSISNRAMVRAFGGCINGLSNIRVAGKPFTVSEYNHPYPIFYGAEGQLMLRAYGAFQGWNGVFEYTYNHRQEAEPDFNTYFFSIVARTDVLAHFPACAAMYLRGDVRESVRPLTVPLSQSDYFDGMCARRTPSVYAYDTGLPASQCLIQKIALDLTGKAPMAKPEQLATPPLAVSDTGELVWDTDGGKNGLWTVNTPNTKVMSGFADGRTVDLGDVSVTVGATRLGWATISLVSHDATGFGQDGKPARILLAATGLSHNSGATFTKGPGTLISSRGQDWGHGPVLCEGIPATIALPSPADRTACYALDSAGNRTARLEVGSRDGKALIRISPEFRTVWYEIEVK